MKILRYMTSVSILCITTVAFGSEPYQTSVPEVKNSAWLDELEKIEQHFDDPSKELQQKVAEKQLKVIDTYAPEKDRKDIKNLYCFYHIYKYEAAKNKYLDFKHADDLESTSRAGAGHYYRTDDQCRKEWARATKIPELYTTYKNLANESKSDAEFFRKIYANNLSLNLSETESVSEIAPAIVSSISGTSTIPAETSVQATKIGMRKNQPAWIIYSMFPMWLQGINGIFEGYKTPTGMIYKYNDPQRISTREKTYLGFLKTEFRSTEEDKTDAQLDTLIAQVTDVIIAYLYYKYAVEKDASKSEHYYADRFRGFKVTEIKKTLKSEYEQLAKESDNEAEFIKQFYIDLLIKEDETNSPVEGRKTHPLIDFSVVLDDLPESIPLNLTPKPISIPGKWFILFSTPSRWARGARQGYQEEQLQAGVTSKAEFGSKVPPEQPAGTVATTVPTSTLTTPKPAVGWRTWFSTPGQWVSALWSGIKSKWHAFGEGRWWVDEKIAEIRQKETRELVKNYRSLAEKFKK